MAFLFLVEQPQLKRQDYSYVHRRRRAKGDEPFFCGWEFETERTQLVLGRTEPAVAGTLDEISDNPKLVHLVEEGDGEESVPGRAAEVENRSTLTKRLASVALLISSAPTPPHASFC